MFKIDLHTHSEASRDGSIKSSQYVDILQLKRLDYIAITDHNKISFATKLNKQLGDKIIIGEEINTKEGEIIGLFLKELIPRNLSVKDTVNAIKEQSGLVYIPHPFETVRRGISRQVLKSIINQVDVIEIFNGRAFFQNKSKVASDFAIEHKKPGAASSDAHGLKGLASTYSIIAERPTAKNLPALLSKATFSTDRPPLITLAYPKYNRIKKGWPRD